MFNHQRLLLNGGPWYLHSYHETIDHYTSGVIVIKDNRQQLARNLNCAL